MRVALVFDPDRRPSKELRAALAEHELTEVPMQADATRTLTEILLASPRVVFLACVRPQPALAALLHEFGIAYTGASPKLALLCEDQTRVLAALARDRVPTADGAPDLTALVIGANSGLQVVLPRLPPALLPHRAALTETAKRACGALGLDSYGQVEMRLADGRPAVVAVRAAPWTEALTEEPYWTALLARGEKVSDVVDRLVGAAEERKRRF